LAGVRKAEIDSVELAIRLLDYTAPARAGHAAMNDSKWAQVFSELAFPACVTSDDAAYRIAMIAAQNPSAAKELFSADLPPEADSRRRALCVLARIFCARPADCLSHCESLLADLRAIREGCSGPESLSLAELLAECATAGEAVLPKHPGSRSNSGSASSVEGTRPDCDSEEEGRNSSESPPAQGPRKDVSPETPSPPPVTAPVTPPPAQPTEPAPVPEEKEREIPPPPPPPKTPPTSLTPTVGAPGVKQSARANEATDVGSIQLPPPPRTTNGPRERLPKAAPPEWLHRAAQAPPPPPRTHHPMESPPIPEEAQVQPRENDTEKEARQKEAEQVAREKAAQEVEAAVEKAVRQREREAEMQRLREVEQLAKQREEELQRRREEVELARKKQEAELARLKQEAEAARQKQEAEAKARREAEHAARLKQEQAEADARAAASKARHLMLKGFDYLPNAKEVVRDGLARCPGNRLLESYRSLVHTWMSGKERGNGAYARAEYRSAAAMYTEGIRACGKHWPEVAKVFYLNRAAARWAMREFAACMDDCNAVLLIDRHCYKAYTRRGRSGMELGHTEKGIADLEYALKLCPEQDRAKLKSELEQAKDKLKEKEVQKEKEKTHYQTLGVGRNFTPEELKEKYRALVKEWHPDRRADKGEEAQQEANLRFNLIHTAYKVLNDPVKRSEYDLKQAAAGRRNAWGAPTRGHAPKWPYHAGSAFNRTGTC